jgi:hypothetical protein
VDISLLGAQRRHGQHQAARNLRQAGASTARKYSGSADGFHAGKLITTLTASDVAEPIDIRLGAGDRTMQIRNSETPSPAPPSNAL